MQMIEKMAFQDFRTRMEILISLIGFIEKFGASSEEVQDDIQELEDMYIEAKNLYLDGDFQGTNPRSSMRCQPPNSRNRPTDVSPGRYHT
jgi:hypothetical protein